MTNESATAGKPFAPGVDEIDTWSNEVFVHLQSWARRLGGSWEVWPPGYLVLEIVSDGERPVDRIALWTADEEVSVTFGYFETELPGYTVDDENLETMAAEQAIELIDAWLAGRLATAVYWEGPERWCGTQLIEEGEILSFAGDANWPKESEPTRIELRTARQSDWRHFSIANGLITEENSPDRGQ